MKIIAVNKKARHEYYLEKLFEAGLQLEGWEVKSLRAGRAQLVESYVIIKKGEAWLIGAHIPPLASTCTHIIADPIRTRKLLLHKREIEILQGAVERKGYALVSTKIYFDKGKVKLEIALAKGKKTHDKRAVAKEKDWQRNKDRLLKQNR